MVRADLATIYQRIFGAGLKEFDDTLANVKLLNPVEEVKEAACVNHGDLATQQSHLLVGGIEHIARNKCCAEGVPVLEQIVANIDELGLQVGANELSAVNSICTKLPNYLSNPTSQIKKDISRAGDVEAEKSLLVARIFGIRDVEKFPPPNARVL
jgi:hypothetical protein